MARPKRDWIPSYYYHIVCRGNRRDPLFLCPDDFQVFFHILNKIHEKFPFEMSSFCLMTNHYHLQMRSQETSISKIMSLINKRYANYYNFRYKLSGHVFEKRFFDKIIVDPEGMLEVSRYIHLNPVEAQMVGRPENYLWSSYRYYKFADESPPEFLNLNSLFTFFEGTMEQKRKRYCLLGKVSAQEINGFL